MGSIVAAWPVPTTKDEAGHVYGVRYADGRTGWVRAALVPFGFRRLSCGAPGCGQCGHN